MPKTIHGELEPPHRVGLCWKPRSGPSIFVGRKTCEKAPGSAGARPSGRKDRDAHSTAGTAVLSVTKQEVVLTFLLLLSERGVLERLALTVAPVFDKCSSGAMDDFRPI